jgi:hypothetical protein
MTAFAGLVDRLFADPSLGRDATWEPADGEPVSIRVVARRADAITEFGGARLWSDTTRVVDGEAFVVQGEPLRDRERLVWTIDGRPE